MNSIPQNIRYLPHTLDTPITLFKTYRNGSSVAFICRRYKVSKASLMRWNKRFDGSKESLCDKSHRPLMTFFVRGWGLSISVLNLEHLDTMAR